MGFIEPTRDGEKLLPRATGVQRLVSAPQKHVSEADRLGHMAEFEAACVQREELDLELRLEDGTVFEHDFIRVYDLRELDAMEPPEDLEPLDPEVEAQIEAEVQAWHEARAEEHRWGSAWPPPAPPDPRWDTMQYHIQVFLHRPDDIDDLIAGEFDDF